MVKPKLEITETSHYSIQFKLILFNSTSLMWVTFNVIYCPIFRSTSMGINFREKKNATPYRKSSCSFWTFD